MIHLFFGPAGYEKAAGRVELEVTAQTECKDIKAGQTQIDGGRIALRGTAHDEGAAHLGALEHAGIRLGYFNGIAVKPQVSFDCFHGSTSLYRA